MKKCLLLLTIAAVTGFGGILVSADTGWFKDDAGRLFFHDDAWGDLTEWNDIEGNTYYFYPDDANGHVKGEAAKGKVRIDDEYYYFNTETAALVKNDFAYIDGVLNYFDGEGLMVTGKKKIADATYYFSEKNTDEYEKGEAVSGLTKVGKTMYYFSDKDFKAEVNVFKSDSGKRYYFDENGKMVTGQKKIENSYYYFYEKDDGKTVKGQMAKEAVNLKSGIFCYDPATGARLKSTLVTYGDDTYYASSDGKAAKGFKTVKGNRYYFDPDTGKMAKGLTRIGGNYYYFYTRNSKKKNQVMGTRASGWISTEGKKFYFDPDTFKACTGMKTIDKKNYYFYLTDNEDEQHVKGQMATGWVRYEGESYYFYKSNTDHTKGTMAKTGWETINSLNYYFYTSGKMAHDTTIDGVMLNEYGTEDLVKGRMIKKAQGLTSRTKYLILVDIGDCKVGIFEGHKGDWKLIKYFKCSPGKPSTPTIRGTFLLGPRRTYFISAGSYCHWATSFCGDYMFHSVLYNKNKTIRDGRLGQHLSHGCVRMAIENAKYIYDNIPQGTKVVTYK